MDRPERENLIQAYFEAIDGDQTETSAVKPYIDDEFSYTAGDGTTFTGTDAINQYVKEVRSLSDTHHEVAHLSHGESASFAEGTVSGTGPGGDHAEVGFCDMFEFDEEKGTIQRMTIYINKK